MLKETGFSASSFSGGLDNSVKDAKKNSFREKSMGTGSAAV